MQLQTRRAASEKPLQQSILRQESDFPKESALIDIDPQGNATSGVGINKRSVKASSYELLIGKAKAEDAIVKTAFKNLDAIPSNIQLAGAEVELVDVEERVFVLKKTIVALKEQYDYILIDCPPFHSV